MTGDELRAVILDPTKCYERTCGRENDIVIHAQTAPDLYADLCREHAEALLIQRRDLISACACHFCAQARQRLLGLGG